MSKPAQVAAELGKPWGSLRLEYCCCTWGYTNHTGTNGYKPSIFFRMSKIGQYVHSLMHSGFLVSWFLLSQVLALAFKAKPKPCLLALVQAGYGRQCDGRTVYQQGCSSAVLRYKGEDGENMYKYIYSNYIYMYIHTLYLCIHIITYLYIYV